MAILQFIFLLQFLPKVYHCFRLMHRMRKVTGSWRILGLMALRTYNLNHGNHFLYMYGAGWLSDLYFIDWEYSGIFTRGDGEEEKDGVETLRHGMVDETKTVTISSEAKNKLPTSSATFTCGEATEAYGLDAEHLWYITDHFRYNFANEKLKRRARYYSSNWRTWAAINIQLAWRHYVVRTTGLVMENEGSDCRLLGLMIILNNFK
ncbi:hypothetical protein LguiB_019649 [Lonicera macranthoides]